MEFPSEIYCYSYFNLDNVQSDVYVRYTKKRILFIFLLGSSFSIYNEVDIFWSNNSLTWSLVIIFGKSINWLITGYLLSKFVKPKHLGAF